MLEHQIPDTVVSTDRTLQSIIAAGGGVELDQATFELAANDAERQAVETKGDAYQKAIVFDGVLVDNCQLLMKGKPNPIPRRTTMVVDPAAPPPFKCFFFSTGARLTYSKKGDDKYWYQAVVYP